MTDQLPPGWMFTVLGDVCTNPQYGYTTKAANTGTIRLLRTTDITSGDIDWKAVPFCSVPPDEPEKYLLSDGDIVISRAGSVGVSFLIKKPQKAVFASYLIRFKPLIDTEFFHYFLQCPIYWSQISENKLGIAVPNINASKLKEIAFLLPPLNEQKRIVAKIEELFSELDNGIAALKTAREQLKVYRQAVLKNAFEGKLTAKWREENADKLESSEHLLARIQQERETRYQQQLEEWKLAVKKWEEDGKEGKKPGKPRNVKIPPLPKELNSELPPIPRQWLWVHPEHLMAAEPYSIGIGPFGSNLKVADYQESGVPLIFVRNITKQNFVDNLKYVSADKADELYAHRVHPLDLVITKMGDPPGDCEIYPKGLPKAVLTADCLKFRVFSEYVDRLFYKSCINSNMTRKQLGLITKGVAQKKISVDRFKTITLPFPPLEEQKVISSELERVFGIIEKIELDLSEQLAKAESLRQSILKKAFSGQLVPQDPDDEPASELLARIKAEKEAAAEKAKKAANKKPSTKRGRKPKGDAA